MSNVKRIVLNSANLKHLLQNDETIKRILEDTAAEVEAAMAHASEVSHGIWLNDTGEAIPVGQPYKEHAQGGDRQKYNVGIRPAAWSDFLYGTVEGAVEAAGGKKTAGKTLKGRPGRKGKKKPAGGAS